MGLRFAWAWNLSDRTPYLADPNIWHCFGTTSLIYTNEATVFAGPLGFSNFSSFARCLRIYQNNPTVQADIPGAAIADGYWHSRFYGTGNHIWYLGDWIQLLDSATGSAVVRIYQPFNNQVAPIPRLYVNGVEVDTFSQHIQTNTEYSIAIKWSGNTATVYMDGVEVASGSSGASFSVAAVKVIGKSRNNSSYNYWDSFQVWDDAADDATRTNIYVFPALPNADVTTTGWTSTGANFHSQLADGSTTTYAQSTVTPATGNLQIGFESRADLDAAFTGGTILGVGVQASTLGDGALTSVEVGIDSNGTSATTSGQLATVNTGWAYHLSVTDPDTGAAWTGTAFDAVTSLYEGS